MTKAELIERIARSRDLPPDITKKDIGQILSLAFDELAGYFAKAKVTRAASPRFTFPGFGTFTKKRRSARRGVNPRTLEPMTIGACHTIDFKASRDLRETMNRGNETGTRPASTDAAPRRTVKATTRRGEAKRVARGTAAPDTVLTDRRRRMTPRDEEAELDALLGDAELFDDDLPDGPVQRVRGRRGSRARTG
jgi:nucleoid DNA-binding protein